MTMSDINETIKAIADSVDDALTAVRDLRRMVEGQIASSVSESDEIYLSQDDYTALKLQAMAAQRVRKIHNRWKTTLGVVCDECRDAYGNLMSWPCDTVKALDGEQK